MATVTRWALAASMVSALGMPTEAYANPYDISVRGLGRPPSGCRTYAECSDDPAVIRYRSLSNELAASMAPRPLAPAETLGMSGFEFSLVSSHTPIDGNAPHWQGQPGNPVFEGVARNRDVPTVFWTPTAHLRKGLPLSSEIGVSGTYLAFSEMFMLGGEFKLAIHESYFRWAPAISTRVAFGRLFGAQDIDIITGEWDLLASLPLGVGGMMQLTPYLGYGQFYVDTSSQVIDETPYLVTDAVNDQRGGAQGSLYTFPRLEWQDNRHARMFVGVRFIVAMIEVLAEFDRMMMNGTDDLVSYSIKFGFDS